MEKKDQSVASCEEIKRQVTTLPRVKKTMKLLRRQRPFLESILKEANQNKRQQLLERANANQINSVSEMVLNLLKDRIPVNASTYGKLKRHKKVLRELGKCRNLVKRPREHPLKQKGCGFWSGLNDCFRACCAP